MSETIIYQTHRVPGASMDLTIPIQLMVNVPDEIIARNVMANARRPGSSRFGRIPRVKTTPAHERRAVMVGSGPSLADHLDTVKRLQAEGCDMFALNGAAAFIKNYGIIADYQVLVDARERTADLIGPARQHLIASQCDPACFDQAPNATMWHFINGELEAHLPEDEEAHAQIGGAGSVGNCALALAWAMGYRTFDVFGYDSSHRDNASHAFHQPLNDFEPWGRFTWRGKSYVCSYTMRSQASRFQTVARALIDNGCTLRVHGDGILPDMWRETQRIDAEGTLEERERLKYELAWAIPDYRTVSPALAQFDAMYAALGSPASGRLIDFGCGSGRATSAFARQGLEVLGVDFVPEALEAAIPFRQSVLWELPDDIKGDFGICCDVMEHMPPDKVATVIARIARAVPTAYFSIATRADVFGAMVGKPLHLTVQSAEWWREHLLYAFGSVKVLHDDGADARFLCIKE